MPEKTVNEIPRDLRAMYTKANEAAQRRPVRGGAARGGRNGSGVGLRPAMDRAWHMAGPWQAAASG